MQNVPTRNEWIVGKCGSIMQDKDQLVRSYIFYMLNKTLQIFEYDGLPDTIQKKDLETLLQVNGFAVWKEVNGKLYCFYAGLGGEPNPYYLPTKAIIANPALRYNATLTIDEDCVVMLNDEYYQGLMPIFNKYSNLLAEAEISLRHAILNARVPALIQADNDNAKKDAERFFDKIERGEGYGIIGSNSFFEGIKSHDFYKQAYIKDLMEAIQYIKGSWYNDIGLKATFNMKREAINEYEASLNDDLLYPFIDTMLEQRQVGVDKVNAMFGTNISVRLNSAWKDSRHEEELVLEQEEAVVELTEAEADKMEAEAEQVENIEQEVNESETNTDTEQSADSADV